MNLIAFCAVVDTDDKLGFITGMELILDDTLAAVDLDDLVLLINSADAGNLIESQEIVDYIKGSPDALAQIKGELPGKNSMYGLPSLDRCATALNTKVKIPAAISGCSTTHTTPSAVWR